MRPGYKQTEVGVIPENWDVIEIESVVPKGVKYGIVDGPFGSNLKTIHYTLLSAKFIDINNLIE